MAKETFLKLPFEKRQRIEEAAIDEFADVGYDKATIDNIVNKADISKGSFYQYFTDKKDLFFYLIFYVIKVKKMEYMAPVLTNMEDHDFFTLFRKLFLAGIKFAIDNPKQDKIGVWFMQNTEHHIFKELLQNTSVSSANLYTSLLQKGIDHGDIREDIDLDYMSYILSNLMLSTMAYFFKINSNATFTDNHNEIMSTIDIMIETIKKGIAK